MGALEVPEAALFLLGPWGSLRIPEEALEPLQVPLGGWGSSANYRVLGCIVETMALGSIFERDFWSFKMNCFMFEIKAAQGSGTITRDKQCPLETATASSRVACNPLRSSDHAWALRPTMWWAIFKQSGVYLSPFACFIAAGHLALIELSRSLLTVNSKYVGCSDGDMRRSISHEVDNFGTERVEQSTALSL